MAEFSSAGFKVLNMGFAFGLIEPIREYGLKMWYPGFSKIWPLANRHSRLACHVMGSKKSSRRDKHFGFHCLNPEFDLSFTW